MGAKYELHPQPHRRNSEKRGAVRMTTLENLWYGNIHPVEKYLKGTEEYKGLTNIVVNNKEKLKNTLSPDNLNYLKSFILVPIFRYFFVVY